jgi:phage tail-like protein
MAAGTRNDPFGQFNFLVNIDGLTVAGFSEVSGLTTDSNVMEYREGSDNNAGVNTMRKLPGLTKYNNIVLKDGITTDNSIWQWRQTVLQGSTLRKSGV